MTSEPHGARYFPVPVGDEQRTTIRASNADRQQTHTYLSAAMSMGVLTPEEYTDRAGTAMAAATLAELDALCADLPMDQLGGAVAEVTLDETRVSTSGAAPVSRAVAVLSTSEVSGGAVVGSHLKATAFLGTTEVDLRDVEFTAPVLTVACKAVMGTVKVIVPTDITVEVHGSGIVGGFSGNAAGPGRPGAPRVIIRGVSFMGSVETERVARGRPTGPRRPN